jgi:outer membrane receptor protein involved in Fe transport
MSLFRIFLFCLFITCTGLSKSFAQQPNTQSTTQTTKLRGRLVDAQNKPVSYATVVLMRSDSSIVNGGLTDDNGAFTIEGVPSGTFNLKVSGIGVETKFISDISVQGAAPKNLGDIKVTTAAAKELKGVVVSAERAQMQLSVDKKVFNVERNITATGGTAADVLQNIPSVSVDPDGNVQLRGKGNVTVLIDGKPATLLGGDVASALQSLPAASIDNVEVMTNPSAKYDAQGMTGILNIVTKKDRKFGFNGNVSVGAGTRDKYNGSLGLNLRNEKWNFFLNSNFKINRNYHITETRGRNEATGTSFTSLEDNVRMFSGFFNTIGAEYSIDDKNTITLTQNINKMEWGNKGLSDYVYYASDGLPTSIVNRYSRGVGGPLSLSTSLDYKHKFDKNGKELTANVTYSGNKTKRDQNYQTYRYNQYHSQVGNTVSQVSPGLGNTQNLNAQVDYTTPFLIKSGKLDVGAKTQMFRFSSSNTPTVDSGNGVFTDYSLLNDFDYTQQTHAGYGNFSAQAGKWRYQAGLRYEYFVYDGTSMLLAGKNIVNTFSNFFPSAFLSYELAKDQTAFLSYTKRTNRPSFWNLMPYLDLSNPQDSSMGNPALQPEFIHNLELNYNKQFKKGHNIILSAYYQRTDNLIERVKRFNPNGTTFSQSQNLASGTTYGFEAIGRLQLMPIWDLTANINLFQNQINGNNLANSFYNEGFAWLSKVNTNVKLPKNFSLQLNGNFESEKVSAQGTTQEVYWIDVALRKNFWNNKASVVLNVSDIFDTRKYTTNYDFPQLEQEIYRNRETRIGNITFSYRFGKSETSRRGRSQNPAGTGKERNNLRSDDGEQSGF